MFQFDLNELLKRFQDEENAPKGVIGTAQPPVDAQAAQAQPAQAQAPAQRNLLAHFLPEDPDKQDALSALLLNAGAGMMAAGAPSTSPTNFLGVVGQGLGAGARAYQSARKDASDMSVNRAKTRSEQVKLQQAQAASDLAASLSTDGDGAYSISDLKKLYQHYVALGEYSAANTILERIQRLDDERRKDGMIAGPNGFQLAPGVAESTNEIERSKAAGRVEGEELFKKTDDIREYEYGSENPDFTKRQIEVKRAGATNVNTGGGSDKQIFDTMLVENEKARQAQTGLTGIDEARNAVLSGGVFGAGADTILGLRKIGQVFGAGDPDKIINTETFRSAIAPQVSAMIKLTVGSANISDSDRAFAEKAAGGNIELDQRSILRLLDIMERANREIITNYNRKLEAVYPEADGKFERERAIFGGVTIPQSKRPDGKADPKTSRVAPQAAVVGTIKTGGDGVQYRFKGGDPNKKENWEPII